MSKINLLDSSVYNLIAAGEVVERPASVVKELIENSIDAGAKNVLIEIKEGGIKYIKVSDDGCGIEEDDIKSAFLPHATSKIKDAGDLETIATLGFRGEALASIASVAKVKVCSKTIESDTATELSVEGGKFGQIKKTSANVGTTMEVSDLFYCVPARAKFLKKPKTEEQEITNIVSRTILAHPDINFSFVVDGKKQLSSLGNSPKEAMFSIYGKESVSETLEVFAEREGVKISGFVGKPTYSKSNRTYQTLIINGRYVVNLTVQSAVSNAYGDFLMKRQYPFFVLYLSVPIDEIDVNVHPNKLDVKFLKSNLVYSVVFEAVSKALYNMDYIKSIDKEIENSSPFQTSQSMNKNANIDRMGVNLNPFSAKFEDLSHDDRENLSNIVVDSMIESSLAGQEKVEDNFGTGSRLLERLNQKISSGDSDAFESVGYENSQKVSSAAGEFDKTSVNSESFIQNRVYQKEKISQLDFAKDDIRVACKLFNTYLVIEWGENVYLIDQHAAHERLNYDKLKYEYENGSIAVQPMLYPYVLSLNSEDDQIIKDNIEAIRSVGFDIEEFGDRTYKISAVPAVVMGMDFNKFFSMFLAEKLGKSKITEAELVKDSLMQMACKSAVKGGDDLAKSEIEKLLTEASDKNAVLFCPHGRPVVVRITKTEIEKWFKRIV